MNNWFTLNFIRDAIAEGALTVAADIQHQTGVQVTSFGSPAVHREERYCFSCLAHRHHSLHCFHSHGFGGRSGRAIITGCKHYSMRQGANTIDAAIVNYSQC